MTGQPMRTNRSSLTLACVLLASTSCAAPQSSDAEAAAAASSADWAVFLTPSVAEQLSQRAQADLGSAAQHIRDALESLLRPTGGLLVRARVDANASQAHAISLASIEELFNRQVVGWRALLGRAQLSPTLLAKDTDETGVQAAVAQLVARGVGAGFIAADGLPPLLTQHAAFASQLLRFILRQRSSPTGAETVIGFEPPANAFGDAQQAAAAFDQNVAAVEGLADVQTEVRTVQILVIGSLRAPGSLATDRILTLHNLETHVRQLAFDAYRFAQRFPDYTRFLSPGAQALLPKP